MQTIVHMMVSVLADMDTGQCRYATTVCIVYLFMQRNFAQR